MADYQFFPLPEEPELNVEPNQQDLDIPEDSEIRLVPRMFSKLDLPQAYDYRSNPLYMQTEVEEDGVKKKLFVPKRKKGATDNKNVHFKLDGMEIPSKSTLKISAADKPLFEQLKTLFLDRPIWIRPMLTLNIPRAGIRRLKTLLPSVAYTFVDGPWRRCWVRLGYDPTAHSASRIYQVVDFRVPPHIKLPSQPVRSKFADQPMRRSMIEVFDVQVQKLESGTPGVKTSDSSDVDIQHEVLSFRRPPIARQTLYQLLDIAYEPVQKLAEKSFTTTCTKSHGFLKSSFFKLAKVQMVKRVKEMIENTNKAGDDDEEEPKAAVDDGMDIDTDKQEPPAEAKAEVDAEEDGEEEEEKEVDEEDGDEEEDEEEEEAEEEEDEDDEQEEVQSAPLGPRAGPQFDQIGFLAGLMQSIKDNKDTSGINPFTIFDEEANAGANGGDEFGLLDDDEAKSEMDVDEFEEEGGNIEQDLPEIEDEDEEESEEESTSS